MKYTLEAIEKIAETLRAMPKVETKKQEVSKSEGVKMLSKEIKSLQKRGYTMKMIAEILTTNELTISESVLKSYMQRSAATGSDTAAKTKTPPKSAPKAPQAPQAPQALQTNKSNLIEDVE